MVLCLPLPPLALDLRAEDERRAARAVIDTFVFGDLRLLRVADAAAARAAREPNGVGEPSLADILAARRRRRLVRAEGSSAILWSDTAGSDASVVMASWRMASRVSHLQLCTVAGTHMRCGVPRIDASVLRYLNSPQQGYIAYLLAVAILAAVHAHALQQRVQRAVGVCSLWVYSGSNRNGGSGRT